MYFSIIFAGALALQNANVLAAAAAACSFGTQTINNRKCITSCGVDRPGGDYSNKYTGTFQACVNACAADPKCATAQFRENNGYCYFKNILNAAKNVAGTDMVVCAPAITTTTSRTTSRSTTTSTTPSTTRSTTPSTTPSTISSTTSSTTTTSSAVAMPTCGAQDGLCPGICSCLIDTDGVNYYCNDGQSYPDPATGRPLTSCTSDSGCNTGYKCLQFNPTDAYCYDTRPESCTQAKRKFARRGN